MLKAYVVHDGDPGEHALLVFAATGQEARVTGHGHEDMGKDGFFSVRAERRKEHDPLVRPEATKAYVEDRLETLRVAGWQFEDGTTCPCCGLSDCDDDRWRACDECEYCPECGHEADCPNTVPGEGECPAASAAHELKPGDAVVEGKGKAFGSTFIHCRPKEKICAAEDGCTNYRKFWGKA